MPQPRLSSFIAHNVNVDEIVEDADEKLFSNIIYSKLLVLHHILPGTKDTKSQG